MLIQSLFGNEQPPPRSGPYVAGPYPTWLETSGNLAIRSPPPGNEQRLHQSILFQERGRQAGYALSRCSQSRQACVSIVIRPRANTRPEPMQSNLRRQSELLLYRSKSIRDARISPDRQSSPSVQDTGRSHAHTVNDPHAP